MLTPDEEPIILDVADEPRLVDFPRASGVVEVLKPIARAAERPVPEPSEPVGAAAKQPSRSNRTPIAASALVTIALVAVAAIYFATRRPGPDIARDIPAAAPAEPRSENNTAPEIANAPDDDATDTDDPEVELVPRADEAPDSNFVPARPMVTRRRARPHRPPAYIPRRRRPLFAAERPPQRPLFRPKLWISDFVPTTLVIYIDKGQVKTRVEPQFATNYNKPPAN